MREIKFRAWDKDKHKMLPTQDLSQARSHWTWLGEFDFPLMQFTGLFDKRGVEIYEGDIVKNQHGAIGWFIWDVERIRFNIKFDKFPGFETLNEWEIIGNIYENPELLK